jgi:hypothetical protein
VQSIRHRAHFLKPAVYCDVPLLLRLKRATQCYFTQIYLCDDDIHANAWYLCNAHFGSTHASAVHYMPNHSKPIRLSCIKGAACQHTPIYRPLYLEAPSCDVKGDISRERWRCCRWSGVLSGSCSSVFFLPKLRSSLRRLRLCSLQF